LNGYRYPIGQERELRAGCQRDVLVEEAVRDVGAAPADGGERAVVDGHSAVDGDDHEIQCGADREQRTGDVPALQQEPRHRGGHAGDQQSAVHPSRRGRGNELHARGCEHDPDRARRPVPARTSPNGPHPCGDQDRDQQHASVRPLPPSR